jgi:Tol biopolymer transport system component
MTSRIFALKRFVGVLVLLILWFIFASLASSVVTSAPQRDTPALTHFGSGATTRLSVTSDGTQGNADSQYPAMSQDGRYIAFYSDASNLVAGDTNGAPDVFVHDRQSGTTERVSVRSGGTQANSGSYYPAISATGRYIIFLSAASNLVAGDTNGTLDVFVHDRDTGQTRRVSIASDGTQANGNSVQPFISGDGRYATFYSFASNLVAGDTNNVADIYTHELATAQTRRISVALGGNEPNGPSYQPWPSYDGRYIAYYSYASNLVSGDTNESADVFVYDRDTDQTRRVSVASDGTEGNGASLNPVMAHDGQSIVFESHATNLVSQDTNGVQDIFVYSLDGGQTQRVSVASGGGQANNVSSDPAISDDGQYVAFQSDATNLSAGDTNGQTDVFLRDLQTGETRRESVATDGTQGNGASTLVSLVGNGRYLAFSSRATQLVSGDTNGALDVFIRDRDGQDATPTPGPTWTPTPSATTQPATPGASATPTLTLTANPPASKTDLFLPLVLRSHFFATPVPTATPFPTASPAPTCSATDQEPNNFFIEANRNLPLCETTPVIGTVSTSDIDDIYRLELNQSGIVRIELTQIPAGADYDLYLYNAERGEVTVSNTPGSASEIIRLNLPDGRYYVRIYSRQYSGANTYQLQWLRE